MTVSLTQEKKAKLKLLCLKALGEGNLVIRFVAQVIGKIVSSLPGVEFGHLHYCHLERDKIQALRRSQGDYDSFMHLSEAPKCELNWWLDVDSHLSRRIKHAPCSLVFQTDASASGCGVRCVSDGALQSQGVWSWDQRTLHINVRELYVVFICLTIFCWNVTGVHLKFELDNITAVAYINSMGSSKSRLCDAVPCKIWAWCIPRDIWVSAIYIPGRTNVVAGRLSREHHSDHEWMLNRQMFFKLCVLYPGLSIDLFATTLNAQLPGLPHGGRSLGLPLWMLLVDLDMGNTSMLFLLSVSFNVALTGWSWTKPREFCWYQPGSLRRGTLVFCKCCQGSQW